MLDLVLRNGWLIDPERLTMQPGSVGVKEGRIAAIYGIGAKLPEAERTVDLGGLAVSPGFIDVHAHLDGHMESGRRALLQGITTSFGGNCGLSPIDMEAFFDSQAEGFCVNQAEFVGHSFSLREEVGLKDAYRAATPAEIRQMEALARRAMEAGAWGVSFGLDYCPGCAFQGVEALGKLAAKMGGICPIHTRLFTMYDMYSISEAALLALNAGVQVQVSHLVYQYPLVHLLDEAFEMLEFAQDRGAHIACDSGMYTHFAAPLGSATFDLDNMEICDWKFDELLVSTGPHKGEWMTESLYRKLRKEAPGTEVVCFSGEDDAIAYAFTRDSSCPRPTPETTSPARATRRPPPASRCSSACSCAKSARWTGPRPSAARRSCPRRRWGSSARGASARGRTPTSSCSTPRPSMAAPTSPDWARPTRRRPASTASGSAAARPWRERRS